MIGAALADAATRLAGVSVTPRLDAEICALRPDIYCKAGDYTLDKLDAGERAALQAVGARIEFMPFLAGFSTTNLIAKIKAAGEV